MLRTRGELADRAIETPSGFHLIRLEARAEASAADLSALRPLVRTRLAGERRAQAEAAFYAELERRGRLQLDDAALAALASTPVKTAAR
jgi:parvulin-like peptidyl-prolyl isomerase